MNKVLIGIGAPNKCTYQCSDWYHHFFCILMIVHLICNVYLDTDVCGFAPFYIVQVYVPVKNLPVPMYNYVCSNHGIDPNNDVTVQKFSHYVLPTKVSVFD